MSSDFLLSGEDYLLSQCNPFTLLSITLTIKNFSTLIKATPFSIIRLGERELLAHNVSKRYLENLRREAWKGRRGSVERGKTYQENLERGKTCHENFERGKTNQENPERGKNYQENFASRGESFQSKTKSLENCVERELEDLSICMEGGGKRVEKLSERRSLENLGGRKVGNLPPIFCKETGSFYHHYHCHYHYK